MGGWYAATVKCNICNYKHVSVHPEECDEEALECPRCHKQDSEVLEYGRPTQADLLAG